MSLIAGTSYLHTLYLTWQKQVAHGMPVVFESYRDREAFQPVQNSHANRFAKQLSPLVAVTYV